MIAAANNILVYAHRTDSPLHETASAAIQSLAEGPTPWAIPWPCLHEFLSVSTNLKIFKPPTPPTQAIERVEIWMESPTLRLLHESPTYWQELKDNFLRGKLSGAQVHDTRIHAICRAHAVKELWSADRDFSRLRGLPIVNPCLK
jgi:toxin-antitoxin system PIN domain toxin